ncbi:hypothetical protein LUZ61_012959 [Rhynchospora tenuis]|uniref:amino-acid N-acetyltransferase n=1 Tax=Rhynchospora tenuis TaxID=198213 RepID=A0AAD6F1Q9_9POAL|nr:hypothetical protein LUZ61_012959 [Rhynchospora tenuis]
MATCASQLVRPFIPSYHPHPHPHRTKTGAPLISSARSGKGGRVLGRSAMRIQSAFDMVSDSSSSMKQWDGREEAQFVDWFRQVWPYIKGHRGSTFVVVISGEIMDSPHLDPILQDISLLHGLGIKFVIVPGTWVQIDKILKQKGREGKYVGPYRITDKESLEAAKVAAGGVRLAIEAKLSPGPPMLNLRRHGDNSRWHELGVAVASGNFLAAKRRGVVEGVDFGATGLVKKINVESIRERLERDCIVIVSNLGYSSSGEILNCNTYEVATATALALQAEKLICIIDGEICDENNHQIRFMTLQDADMLIRKRAGQSPTAATYVNKRSYSARFQNGVGFDNGNGLWTGGEQGFAIGGEERQSRLNGYFSELTAAAFVCQGGVQRVQLIDGRRGGALLLELFTRDGVGTMVASDMYEGTRTATEGDVAGIKLLLKPLEDSGALVQRTDEELVESIGNYVVVERDGSLIACAALFPFVADKCAEVAAFAVSPECRGNGQGDKLLDYVEKKAASLGLERLFLLTTRALDWFERRGFSECSIESLPEEKRKRINRSRGSKCYMKTLLPDRGGITINGHSFDNTSL